MATTSKNRRNLLVGLAFLGPNILGFLAFMLIPLCFSLVLAFSDWDLRRHNMFKWEPLKFVGLENFQRLFAEPNFYKYLGNTLFFMMGTPFAIAGSLVLAMLLSKEMRGGSRKMGWSLLASAAMAAGVAMLVVTGMGQTAMVILLTGLAGGLLVGGVGGGSTVYRTIFYLPSFTSGVAVYILWKKLYNSRVGPVSTFLEGPLGSLSETIRATPAWTVQSGMWLCVALTALLVVLGLRHLRRMWVDGDLGWAAALLPVCFLALPVFFARRWLPDGNASGALITVAALWAVWQLVRCSKDKDFSCSSGNGFGTAAMFSAVLMSLEFVLIGLGIVFFRLPQMAAGEGIQPPDWLADYSWAKPSIMIMGFWMALGSRNMLLYLAGLSNVPQELYEAADIDGASRFQKFWSVTWPQLAPTTFFIIVMSVIGGLQGGFEMARTMTGGGPAGATTTLSYFIFNEGFATGRLGYSSAIAWTLFAMVFTVTIINWRFGSRYVNE